jgi:uncharacterized protein
MPLNLPLIVQTILDKYALPRDGTHGVGHWARVLENGIRLAKETGANVGVVTLFAVFHDSKRVNESTDLGHGRRGADFATELRGHFFDLPDDDFGLLYKACAEHTDGQIHDDMTVQTCWDADRLDLGRVGIMPHLSKLCTDAAKTPEMIKWADGRASFGVVPEFVMDQWGVELD